METNNAPVVDLFEEIKTFISKKGKKSPKEIAQIFKNLDKIKAKMYELEIASQEAEKLKKNAKYNRYERIARIILSSLSDAF